VLEAAGPWDDAFASVPEEGDLAIRQVTSIENLDVGVEENGRNNAQS